MISAVMLLSQESQYLDYNERPPMFQATDHAKGLFHRDILTISDIKYIIGKSNNDMFIA